ncbi:hypothetical protein TNCV_4463351 [Trichonephila clavipes]|nr:hypothetical protein TNCV_4463351 [Trichonephila clavipes]
MTICEHPRFSRKRYFGVCSKLKKILDADSDDENEMNNAAPVPTTSEMRNTHYEIHNHSNNEMNEKNGRHGTI